MSPKELQRRDLITEVPKGIKYDLMSIEAQTSFGATLEEAARQAGDHLGVRLSCETIADIITDCTSDFTLDGQRIYAWIKGAKPKKIELAIAVARIFNLPEEYFTRFYETTVSSPLYEKS